MSRVSRASRPRHKGFGLLAVLLVLAVMGGAIAAIGAQCGAIAWQTEQARSQARQKDLQASALAWARHNRSTAAWPAAGQAKALDTAALGVPAGRVSVEHPGADANQVRITSACGLGGRIVEAAATFDLPPRRTPK